MSNFDALTKKLESEDAEERREAAVALGQGGKEAVPYLFPALKDADWRVRKTAVDTLVAFNGDQVISHLIQALFTHDNAGERNSAIEALIRIGTRAVEALQSDIGTRDADVRKFIVDILGDIRDIRAVPALIAALEDDDENIRVAAAEALGKMKDRRAVDALLACLTQRGRSWLDYAAAEALGEIGEERALGPLLVALSRSSLREPVLESLGKIGNVDTLSPLIAGLADPLRIVREVSATALAAIHQKSVQSDKERMVRTLRSDVGDQAVAFLEELLVSGAELQKTAIALLGWTGRESSIEKILSLLKEEELEEPIVQALKDIDGKHSPILLGYLSDENALVRRSVSKVLGELGSDVAEGPLMRLLADDNGHVRSAAAEALGRLRSGKAVQPLLALLSDEYVSVQEAAIHALAEIGDDSILDDLVKKFSQRDAPMRRNIALLLGKFATERAVDALAFALKDEEPEVRKAVVQALGSLTAQKAQRPLILALTDDDPEVRMLAAEALARTDSPESREALLTLLEDSDIWVRAAAARGLGKIGGEKVAAILTEHLEQASDIFLLALVEVVGRLKAPQALGPLFRLSGHPDPEVRKTVLSALSAFGGPAVEQTIIMRLSDAHWSVRKVAVDVLKRSGSPETGPYLRKLADADPDETVRRAAKEALGK